jgi:hypothetical protein
LCANARNETGGNRCRQRRQGRQACMSISHGRRFPPYLN